MSDPAIRPRPVDYSRDCKCGCGCKGSSQESSEMIERCSPCLIGLCGEGKRAPIVGIGSYWLKADAWLTETRAFGYQGEVID